MTVPLALELPTAQWGSLPIGEAVDPERLARFLRGALRLLRIERDAWTLART